jgi:carboxyl-terminal processing protease
MNDYQKDKLNYIMKKLRIFKSWRSFFIAGTIAVCSWLFVSFDDNDDFELAKNLDIYHTLIRELRLYYVDDINLSNVFESSIDNMLETLDPYTVYFPESEIEDYRFITTGQYGGIGAVMRTSGDDIVIEEIYENFPAAKAGFKPGDIVKKVGDQNAGSSSYDDISILMKGAPDTQIEVTVFRPSSNNTITKVLNRERIRIENVPYYGKLNESVGYIKLTGFTQTAYSEVKDAFDALKSQNINSLIFDLRDNPGGLLLEAVKIVGMFVEKGTNVVNTKGKVKQWNQNFNTFLAPVDTNIPIVVIVNRNSASASEIVAGALQDLDRAVILGERTYGKGLVQTTRDLSYNAKLKVTTAKYYIPSGRCIQALDYSHRNPDGSVGYVPDSLISEFKTSKGRKVYDGGGVIPDVKITFEENSPIANHLLSSYIIFDYATAYSSKLDSIVKPELFEISDADYNKFIDFAASRKLEYKTETELALDKLIETAKKEKYYSGSSSEIESLKKSLKHGIKDDMLMFKQDISKLLCEEIVKRFYYDKGTIKYEIKKNSAIEKALVLIKDLNGYNSLLMPK